MTFTLFSQKIRKNGAIYLLQHDDHQGTYEYYAIRVATHKSQQFERDLNCRALVLEDYGEILLQDAGPLNIATTWEKLLALELINQDKKKNDE